MNFAKSFQSIHKKGFRMKWFLILALMTVVSCAHKKEENKDVAASQATESDSKPISPLTVQPCLCMKIFQPVCAGGQNYGNSCEAECNGHKTWTEGDCATAPVKPAPKKSTKKK
jgi:hypothetical protein